MLQNKKVLRLIYILMIGIVACLFIFLLVKLFPFYKVLMSFLLRLSAPFFIAALIAYLLYPLIVTLHKHHILKDLNVHLLQFIQMYEELIYALYESTSFLPEAVHDQFDQIITRIESSLEKTLGKLLSWLTKIFDLLVLITVIPVLVFYFLK